MKNKKFTPYAKAITMVVNTAKPVDTIKKKLKSASGLVLRKAVRSDRPLPPFNRSAMDGYAVKCADFKNGRAVLRVTGVLEAGSAWKGRLKRGESIKIMTGAPLPDGAEAVIKVEQSCRMGTEVELTQPRIEKWLNVHRKGADCKKGELLLEGGSLLSPGAMSVAAAVGQTNPTVTRKITVTVITTGSELVPAHRKPSPSQIRESNSYLLMSRLSGISWVKARYAGTVRDDPEKFKTLIKKALAKSDMVLVTGGVSMGDTDYTYRVLKKIGVTQKFHKAAIRPGKPLWFGKKGKTIVFGLPGNPVSVAVTFHEFAMPALRMMAGIRADNVLPASITLPLAGPVKKKHQLREFRVASITKGGRAVAVVSSYQGSGDFVSAAKSDGVIVLPEQAKQLKAGQPVEFHSWKNF